MKNSNFFIKITDNKENISDEQLVLLAKNGDQNALNSIIDKYKSMVSAIASKYFIIGAEKEDIIQEGMIGLFKAVKSFQDDKQASFKSFADLCIKRQLITAIKTSTRQKHIPLNSYLSLNKNAYEEEGETELINVLDLSYAEDPLEEVANKEAVEKMESKMNSILSSFEKNVLDKYLKGYSYNQIAQKLETHVKSVDNAIQRIKKKVSKIEEV